MSNMHRFAIASIAPSCQWIEEFLDELNQRRGDVRQIAWECRMQKKTKFMVQRFISDEFAEIRRHAKAILLPFLEPKHHIEPDTKGRHEFSSRYLAAIGKYSFELASDPRTVIVYDYGNMPEWSQKPEVVATQESVDAILGLWRQEFGPGRILTREAALQYLLMEMSAHTTSAA